MPLFGPITRLVAAARRVRIALGWRTHSWTTLCVGHAHRYVGRPAHHPQRSILDLARNRLPPTVGAFAAPPGAMTVIAISCDPKIQTPSFEAMVNRWVMRLEDVDDSLLTCALVLESHGRVGQVRVLLNVTVPGDAISVVHEARHSGATAIYVAVYDAFRAARHQLIARAPAAFEDQPTQSRGFLAVGSTSA